MHIRIPEFANIDLRVGKEVSVAHMILYRSLKRKNPYRILIREELTRIESSIRIAYTQRQTRPGRIREIVIDDVEIIRSKVLVPERRVGGHRGTCWSRARQARIQSRCDGQRAGVCVVVATRRRRSRGVVPDEIHGVVFRVVWIFGLPEESEWSLAGDIDLFCIIS